MEDIKKDEKKTIGIKAGEETAAAWDEFWNEMKTRTGINNKEDAFRELLKLADIDKMKEIVPGRADDLRDFKLTLDKLMTKYLSSVQAYADARDRAADDVKLEMQTKTQTISDLQKKQEEMKQRIETLEQALDSATTENNRLQVEVNKLNESIADKDALISTMKKNKAAAADAVSVVSELKEVLASMKKETAEPEKKK